MSPIPPPMTSRPNLVTMPSRLPNPWRTRPTFATIRVMPLRLTHLIQLSAFRCDGPGQNLIMPSQPSTTIRSLPHPASTTTQSISLRVSPTIPPVYSPCPFKSTLRLLPCQLPYRLSNPCPVQPVQADDPCRDALIQSFRRPSSRPTPSTLRPKVIQSGSCRQT